MTNEPRDHPHKGLSLSRRSASGKGDRQRRVDGDRFRKNYDAIDWQDKKDTKGGKDD